MGLDGDKLVKDILDGNLVDLKDDFENEIAEKITAKIKTKKKEIMQSLNTSRGAEID